MKGTNIFYWITTILICLLMAFSSVASLLQPQQSAEMMNHQLGYPAYIIAFLSVAKLLGAIAILVPGFPRLKEWAYAGFFFDLSGAMYSMIMSGQKASGWAPMILFIAVLFCSYFAYHKRKTLSPAKA